ncbi:MAG: hypothetical protein NTZ60_02645 [Campylobacterales bacterium]|nr:hypothetical protein [Campylobacterales bacterium]
MKTLKHVFFFLFISVSSLYSATYADMTKVSQRANDLGMLQTDYSFAMALTGMLSGTMLGMFLWKTR